MKGWVYHARVQEYGEKASTLIMVLCEMLKFEKCLTLGIRENPAPAPGTWWWALSSLCYYRGNILSLSLMVRSSRLIPFTTATEQGSSLAGGSGARVASPLLPRPHSASALGTSQLLSESQGQTAAFCSQILSISGRSASLRVRDDTKFRS